MSILQNPPTHPAFKNPWKRPIIYSSVIALAITCYVGFILFTRWESNRDIEKRNAIKTAEERRASDAAVIQQLGGSELSIRALYVSPPLIHPGENAQLCYDVANAKTVTLDPPVGEVWPSHTRCLDVSPKKTTTYTLTIKDAASGSTSQSVKLEVKEREPIHVKSFPSQ